MIEKLNFKTGILDYNAFNIDKHKSFKEQRFELNEDLIQIGFNDDEFTIDVGWYPFMNPKGSFTTVIIYRYNWNFPLFEKKCFTVDALEQCLQEAINIADALAHTKTNAQKIALLIWQQRYTSHAYYFCNILENNNILYSWNTLYVGKKLGLLYFGEIKEYAINCVKHNLHVTPIILKLARSRSEKTIDLLLDEMFKQQTIEKNSTLWIQESLKWRYCILNDMVNFIEHDLLLWIKVYDMFEIFDFPSDMLHLLYPVSKIPISPSYLNQLEEYIPQLRKKLQLFLSKSQLE